MEVLRGTKQLADYFSRNGGCEPGCLADTGLLYAASYMDDRLYNQAVDVFEVLAEYDIRVYANVISRMEFIDLIFRKQVTNGAIEIFNEINSSTVHKDLFNLLKSLRDENTAQKRDGQSYKINEGKLKRLRSELEKSAGPNAWKKFCAKFTGKMLTTEWEILEEELGLYFVEVLEGQTSDIIAQPLNWRDMVNLMGKHGIRGPDAMIANLFLKSRLPLLITTDKDISNSFDEDDPQHEAKTIFYLD